MVLGEAEVGDAVRILEDLEAEGVESLGALDQEGLGSGSGRFTAEARAEVGVVVAGESAEGEGEVGGDLAQGVASQTFVDFGMLRMGADGAPACHGKSPPKSFGETGIGVSPEVRFVHSG